ncbi:glycosyltransferase family 2 protein [Bizionia hallyeonensis]|uniref:Glycosyltransferase family 2 protein n=1 Tax=Bizionia hallyeonensis TaxID=1123757 RepID=A0ABW0C5G7_9FLAO
MLFHFLKYLQPVHYFTLNKSNGVSAFPIVENLPLDIVSQLDNDTQFLSDHAQAYDLSWQAIHKGYIGDSATYLEFDTLPLVDNYRFIRKYFHSAWVIYVLLLRLISFKNPLKELKAFYNTRLTKRSSYLKTPILYTDWAHFQSKLFERQPKVSVIIPTLNRYVYLKDVLADLELQDYPNFEVIVVDQSDPYQPDFYSEFQLDLRVVYQEEKALWLARNTAIRMATGKYVLLFDDDSRVDGDWISSHLRCLDYFQADLSSGVSISTLGAKVPQNYAYFRVSDQLDTGNVLIKKDVFKKIGLFDRQFEKQRMGDGEFGLRAYLHGFLNVSNPYAKRLHLKVDSGGLREMGSWDAFRTKKWFAPRPIPSVLYYFRTYYGNQAARWALLRSVPLSIMPYQFKSNKRLMVVGVFVSLLLFPVVVFQVLKSWRMAGVKLKEGSLIEEL